MPVVHSTTNFGGATWKDRGSVAVPRSLLDRNRIRDSGGPYILRAESRCLCYRYRLGWQV